MARLTASIVARYGALIFACVLALSVSMAAALSQLLQGFVQQFEWRNTSSLVRHEVAAHGLEGVFDEPDPSRRRALGAEAARVLTAVPGIARIKVWSPDAVVLWSDEPRLIERRFPDNLDLRAALEGRVTARIRRPRKTENLFEAGPALLAEVYVPIHSGADGRVRGVIELYKDLEEMAGAGARARRVVWAISLGGAVALFAAVLPLLRLSHQRQAEQAALLERQVAARTQELQDRTNELRAALQAVEQAQQRVVQTERLHALGEMAGGVAHDFNNALAVILGRIQLLRARTKDDPAAQTQVETLERAALDAARTVRRVQEFARMRPALASGAVDLDRVVREVLEATSARWRNDAEARGICYDVRVESAPLPPVEGDAAELREALTNLVLNALDAMPDGGRLTLRTGVEGDRVVCTVADTGGGIPEEIRSRIFEPFFTTKGERGTGLGLSVVYGIVTRHGGTIDVQSTPGGGSAFTIRLPVGSAAPRPTHVAGPAPVAAAPARILIVDDNAAFRDILRACLEAAGHEVVEAASGPEGLAACEREPFQLVVTDIAMPGMSGWEVARQVRRRFGWPVGVVTGWGDDEADPGVAGAVDFVLTKPFQLDEVRRRVAEALQNASARSAGSLI